MRPMMPPPGSEGMPPPPPSYLPVLVSPPGTAGPFFPNPMFTPMPGGFPPTTFSTQFFTTPTKPAVAAPSPTAAQSIPTAQRGPTVYVGRLPTEIDDIVIRQMLQECGSIIRWSRTSDPITRKLSTFGFCEFESPLGVMRAVKALNGLVIDDNELVANCEDKFKEGLEQWRRDHKLKLQEENPSKSVQEIDADIEKEEARIKSVTQKLAQDAKAKLAAARQQAGLEAGIKPLTEEDKKEKKRREWLDSLIGYVDINDLGPVSNGTINRIKLWNLKLKEGRIELRKRLQAWEKKETAWNQERKKRREEAAPLVENPSSCVTPAQRNRLIDLDILERVYYLSYDGSIWENELSSRRQDERTKKLTEERENDIQDAIVEQKALEEKARKEDELKRLQEKEENKRKRELEEKADESTISGPIKISLPAKTVCTTIEEKTTKPVSTSKPSISGLFVVNEDDDEDYGNQKKKALPKLEQIPQSDFSHKKLLEIALRIPKEKDELFKFPLDWNLFISKGIMEHKVAPWIGKKVTEFFGEEEPELTTLILEKLKEQLTPEQLIQELKEFLDEDAESFINKLWKLLVFEALRLK